MRKLTEQELEQVTKARLEYEDEIDVKLYALRDVELFQAGFIAGLDYAKTKLNAYADFVAGKITLKELEEVINQ